MYVEVPQKSYDLIIAGLDVMQEKEVLLSEANLESFVSGQTSNESIEGADKLLGTPCTLLYLRYGINVDGWMDGISIIRSGQLPGVNMSLKRQFLYSTNSLVHMEWIRLEQITGNG